MSTTLTTLLIVSVFSFGIAVGILVEGFRRNLLEDANSHVHDWGRWEKKEVAAVKWSKLYGAVVGTQEYTAVWQERACTSCGYIEREELELP